MVLMKTFVKGMLLSILFAAVIPGVRVRGQNITVQQLLAIPAVPPDHEISYGADPLQFGQLRLPDGNGPYPVVVVIHGGCWLARYDLQHISPLAKELTRIGVATWSLEYRRVGNEGGGWPGTFQDIAQGIDHLREVAKSYPLDLSRVIALGHSSGGHLALWAAARSRLPRASPFENDDPLPLLGVVSLAGVADLGRDEYQRICGNVVQKLMGGTPSDVPERYAQGSPISLLPLKVPQILIQGVEDRTVSPASATDYYAAALRRGDQIKLVMVKEAGHFEVVVPTSSVWPEVAKAVSSLIQR